MKYSEYPENEAVLIEGNCCVVKHIEFGHYCGYCRLPSLVAESSYLGILTYVPVHGGITYASSSKHTDQMIYGFDCGHAGDEMNWRWHDPQAVLWEAKKMDTCIKIAAVFEPFYLLTANRARAFVLDLYHRVLRKFWGIEFDLRDNFGSMINVLCGRL